MGSHTVELDRSAEASLLRVLLNHLHGINRRISLSGLAPLPKLSHPLARRRRHRVIPYLFQGM